MCVCVFVIVCVCVCLPVCVYYLFYLMINVQTSKISVMCMIGKLTKYNYKLFSLIF